MSKAQVPQISLNVMIMTREDFNKHMDAAFQRGVKRGRFEERHPPEEALAGIDRWDHLSDDHQKLFEVWCEGFVAQGNSAKAEYKGRVRADSFRDACDILLGSDETYNAEQLTLWGCRLYDNESAARKCFG